MGAIKTFGPVDERSLKQLERCMAAGEAEFGVLCADHHPGYSQPIGGGIAYEGYVSPSGVGYDIGCIGADARVLADGYSRPIHDVCLTEPLVCIDRGSSRPIHPHFGAVPRGCKRVRALELVNGRSLTLTPDHRVLTRRGWVEARDLDETDVVACTPYVGTGYEPCGQAPELLRLVAYVSGDGHLTRDGKSVAIYTTVESDAEALVADAAGLGYRASTYRRSRGAGRRTEICVRISSKDLHGHLAALGSPVGRKHWSRKAFDWLFEAPRWARALFLSAFASAEMTTPRLVDGTLASLAVKQADSVAARLIVELFASLGFRTSIAASGSQSVVQVVGGEDEQIRFFEEVGFCRASEKRAAAAVAASVAWRRRALIARRQAARLEALSLRALGVAHRNVVADVAARFDVPRGLVHHAVYNPRPLRRGLGVVLQPDTSVEVAWVPVDYVGDAGTAEVWDVATADPAESFVADGIVVHNCGNKAAETALTRGDLEAQGGVEAVMREITRRISFGIGVSARERVDHPVLERIRNADFAPHRKLVRLAADQLGTVGAGNHYVNLMEDEQGRIWVGVHFGSRGFGYKTASGFLALSAGKGFEERAAGGEMDSPPVLFEAGSELGETYISAMQLAGEYAYAGRDVVVSKVLEILGTDAVHEVHNHHNFAWLEEHFGRPYWVIRKGCTPARPGQEGFVGGSMGDDSVILEGVGSAENEQALFSTVHGAGRVMSRSQAAGRVRRQTVYACSIRDCDFSVPAKGYAGEKCPEHPQAKMRKWRGEQVVRPGVVDWPAVQARLRERGIVLVGGGADEAPEVYKRLPEVLAAHGGTIRVKHTLRPLGVAMAGRDVHDPYKD